jgi:hypothetical protein
MQRENSGVADLLCETNFEFQGNCLLLKRSYWKEAHFVDQLRQLQHCIFVFHRRVQIAASHIDSSAICIGLADFEYVPAMTGISDLR